MAGLVDTQIRDSYKSVLRVDDNTDGIDSASKYVGDGEGTDSVLSLSTTKVGIGTTSPISVFEIEDGLTTGGAILTLGTKEPTVVANDVLGRINFYAPLDTGTDSDEIGASIVAVAQDTFSDSVNSTQLEFQTGKSEVATTKMVINEDGNVGIGTAAPSDYASSANDLVVYGSGNSGITIVSGTENDGSIYFADANSGPGEYRGYIWYNHDVDRMYLGSNAEPRITLNEDGEVGIGTTAPADLLEVEKDQDARTSIRIDNGTSGASARASLIVEANHGDVALNAFSGGYTTSHQHVQDSALLQSGFEMSAGLGLSAIAGEINFWTGLSGTKKMTIANDGKVGIGVTPTANMTGLAIEAGVLTVKGIDSTPTADSGYGKIWCHEDSGGNANKLYYQAPNGTVYTVDITNPAP